MAHTQTHIPLGRGKGKDKEERYRIKMESLKEEYKATQRGSWDEPEQGNIL